MRIMYSIGHGLCKCHVFSRCVMSLPRYKILASSLLLLAKSIVLLNESTGVAV